jgi:sister-chromatid-cohesion protein PDS5
VSLLRLATVPIYAGVITETASFLNLALTTQDELHPVRQRFMSKLIPLLVARKLPHMFNTMVFLTIHDPETEIPNMVCAGRSDVRTALSSATRSPVHT